MRTGTPHRDAMSTETTTGRGPLGRLVERVTSALVADEEASLRYAAVDAELDGRVDDALHYAADLAALQAGREAP